MANKPVTGESTKETVKTIARGMPGVFRCDRGDYRVLSTLCTRASGASGARHSLRPLLRVALRPLFEGGAIFQQSSGVTRREIAESYLKSE